MKDERLRFLDDASRLAVVTVDVTAAAQDLARAHLSGPVAGAYLAEALAGVALLGAETGQADETVTFKLTCPGPLGGFLVECTERGTLRGYTNRKILDADGGAFDDGAILGDTGTVEIIRSVPGAILSSAATAAALAPAAPAGRRKKAHGGVARALNAYFEQSLQRRVRVALAGAAGDDGVPFLARGILAECPPDGDAAVWADVAARFDDGTAAKALALTLASPQTLLRKLALARARPRATPEPLAFACRCSRERAQAMVAALPEDQKAGLPPQIDITCHMCGRTWTVTR